MRRYDVYKLKRNDNLGDPVFWNTRFEDIDLRLAASEDAAAELQKTADSIAALALSRLNETFMPLILEAQSRLNSLGVSFSSEATNSLTVGSGTKLFILTEETAANYVYTEYITARSAISPSNTMTGAVTSFDRVTRHLTVEVDRVTGSGTFADWLIRVGYPPGSTHETDLANPHQTTAAQVGAYTIAAANAAISAAIVSAISALSLQSASQHPASDFAASGHSHALSDLSGTLGAITYLNMAASALADVAAFRAGTAGRLLPADVVFAAAAYIPLTDAATIALDLSSGFNFSVTIGASRILGFPTNGKVGQSGYIDITNTGNYALTFASGYTFDLGITPTIDQTNGRVSTLFYHYRSATECRIGTAFKGVRGA
jgi:hypothetical protein